MAILNNEFTECSNCQVGRIVNGSFAPRSVDIVYEEDPSGFIKRASDNTKVNLKQFEARCGFCPLGILVNV